MPSCLLCNSPIEGPLKIYCGPNCPNMLTPFREKMIAFFSKEGVKRAVNAIIASEYLMINPGIFARQFYGEFPRDQWIYPQAPKDDKDEGSYPKESHNVEIQWSKMYQLVGEQGETLNYDQQHASNGGSESQAADSQDVQPD